MTGDKQKEILYYEFLLSECKSPMRKRDLIKHLKRLRNS